MRYMKSAQFMVLGILFVVFMSIGLPTIIFGADTYPSKPVRLIIPYAPGGGSDVVGRLIATRLIERLGKQMILENRGGAGGIIAAEMVAKAVPDGYTLLWVAGFFTIQPALEKLPYDPMKSFTPIAKLGVAPYTLVVHPSVPANSVKEFIALAKQKPDQLICGTSGKGSTGHMGTELFKIMSDVDFKIVHFKSTGPALTDLLGGHSHAMMNSIPGLVPHIKSGKLKGLATTAAKRSVTLPDVPTISEAGIPGFNVSGWWGIVGPVGIPAPIVDRLNKELKMILTSAEVKKQLLDSGVEVDYLGPTEFVMFLEEEIIRWASVVKKANIKLEK